MNLAILNNGYHNKIKKDDPRLMQSRKIEERVKTTLQFLQIEAAEQEVLSKEIETLRNLSDLPAILQYDTAIPKENTAYE